MRLPFELDPQIIHHIIYSQAGSIGKAIIELLMNSVDAHATNVSLTLSKVGFECRDDGIGFASREDVLRYFGRFGTPHQEGDATYGRFRLGRGQIMAHATTDWRSSLWRMRVDTRSMGYSYELDELLQANPGCSIAGTWYDALSDAELQSALQEIRDLVRYTPVTVELNGRLITRMPTAEKWDHEDEHAYYRVKEEGSVAIYNQGVLVRHDSSHLWGAGGLIVSKRAIGLNVSRTEILRKSCPTWREIAKQFDRMATALAARLGDHRKTEARREKSARAMLSGDPQIVTFFEKEEVITVLPGKRHMTLERFLRTVSQSRNYGRGTAGNVSVLEGGGDVPKGEAIARERVAVIVHPSTLDRFGCYSVADFKDGLERVFEHLHEALPEGSWHRRDLQLPDFVAFAVLQRSFVERTQLVDERKALDKETRRAWIALRWCLQEYADQCMRHGRVQAERQRFAVFLGESNAADAWTDGRSYIAIGIKHVRRLRTDPLRVCSRIFSYLDHELAHEGDSLDCGHDEAFFQRYHDLSVEMAEQRQHFIHVWLRKYTRSLEMEGKWSTSGNAWYERRLLERAGDGRLKRGMSPAIEDLGDHPAVVAVVPEQNMALLREVNTRLVSTGRCPASPNWEAVVREGTALQRERDRLEREGAAERQARSNEENADLQAWEDEKLPEIQRVAKELALTEAEVWSGVDYLDGQTGDELRELFARRPWHRTYEEIVESDLAPDREESFDPMSLLVPTVRALVKPGEDHAMVQRNAAAAGFFDIKSYLLWRHEQEA